MLLDGSREVISCRDIPGLRAELQVGLDDLGYIVLVTPQREYVYLTADDSAALRAALEAAEGEVPARRWPS